MITAISDRIGKEHNLNMKSSEYRYVNSPVNNMNQNNTNQNNTAHNNTYYYNEEKPEKPLHRKIRQDFRYFGGLSVIYGLIFTFCLYKNLHGITFPICVAATIAFAILFMKRIDFKLQKQSVPYIVGMVLLGISTAYTSSFFFHFFNTVGIVLLFSVFMIHQFYNDHTWNLPGYMKRILILFGTTIESIPYPFRHGSSYLSGDKSKKNRTLTAVFIGGAVAVGMLCVILPLLMKSDMMFSKIFGQILKHINFGTIMGVSITFLIGAVLCYAFFAALCKYNFPEGRARTIQYYNPVIGITFTGIISVIYVLYCLVQIIYLFAGLKMGLPQGVTYAEYARGGFWELLFVSIINFIMVLLCMYLFYENVILKIVLTIISGCTFIMILSAAYRMILYIGVYHLTFLRILVLWFLVVLTLIMAGTIISMYKKSFPLFRYIMIVVSVLYIMLAFMRPDVVAIRYNISHGQIQEFQDIEYFMYNASLDCAPEIAKINMDYYTDEWERQMIDDYFKNISEEYDDVFFRKANYSEIRAKLAADSYNDN